MQRVRTEAPIDAGGRDIHDWGPTMRHHSSVTSIGHFSHDAWSEAYVGVQWLVSQLPAIGQRASARDGALSQMVLLASHHLVEVMFFRGVRSILDREPGKFPAIEAEYDSNVSFSVAIRKWPKLLVGKSFDFGVEPMKSVMRLRDRRNATIHKDSALTTPENARSALHSAVKACEVIAEHLLGPGGFRYASVLRSYSIEPAPWFSEAKLVEAVDC